MSVKSFYGGIASVRYLQNQGSLGKIQTKGALFSVKNSVVLNANNPSI